MKYLSIFVFVVVIFMPDIAAAQGGFVPCSGTDCSLCHFAQMGSTILQWLIGVLFVVFAVMVAVAGFGLVTSGGNPSAKQAAKDKLMNALVGIIIVLAAWLIVDTLVRALVGTSGQVNGKMWHTVSCQAQLVPQDTGNSQVPTPNGVDCNNTAALIATYSGSPVGQVNPGLQTMISCYLGDPAINAGLDHGQIYTVDQSNPICAATNGNPVCSPCSHSVNSTHYGRGSGQGAMGVDFNSSGITENQLYNLLQSRQGQCGGTMLFEGNHTHVSM